LTKFGRREGVIVPPLSRAKIAQLGVVLRKGINLNATPRFPIVEIYDWLGWIVTGAEYQVVESHLMGDDDARTYPDKKLIQIREEVYDAAAQENGRARFTLAHELGHLMMHRNISFARVNPQSPPRIFENSEWQADVFASHLLMPDELIASYSNVENVMRDFGVSHSAAELRIAKKLKG
jgi:Zn-dependent peptidase ImmA (M78 family)